MHWLAGGETVVFRHKLTGHSGEGIEIVSKDTHKMNEIPKAPLYTKYTKKKDEYRIHVFGGEVVFQQRKARRKEVPDDQVNWQVRNLAGGFIFANDGVVAPDVVQTAAVQAVQALGLDFGAADIGFKDGAAVVYEVNTACGLQGKNLESYVNKFKAFL
jgi:glutathione synthase/RimK-type ligase-like ATP-grasp enzyme